LDTPAQVNCRYNQVQDLQALKKRVADSFCWVDVVLLFDLFDLKSGSPAVISAALDAAWNRIK